MQINHRRYLRGRYVHSLACFVIALYVASLSVAAQSTAPQLDYTVRVANAAQHLFHITVQVNNVVSPTTDLSLPAWTPGWYTIMPYSANVMRLQAKDSAGNRLRLYAVDKQTWRIETKGNRTITVDYDYLANNLSVNGAELNEQRGYFVGTNLFLYAPGHTTDTPANVKFEVPAGWRVATGLQRASEPNSYRARNYDHLVDCPVILGDYDEGTATAQGKTIHVIVDKKGQYNAEQLKRLTEMSARVIDSQGRMFGGLPYEEYWVLFVTGPNLRVGGALEHENSTNFMAGREMPRDPASLIDGVSHEHFHVWNVKRLKPTAIIPYDYSREMYFRELWFAEGVTDYYTDVHLRRAKVISPEEYLQSLSRGIDMLQRNEARLWISAADASVTTWTTYTGGGPFTVNYYNKGALLGMLLDLEIRGATTGKRSLDDVLRHLFDSFYKQGRGYTVEDVEQVCSQLAGRSFKDFFAKYITGTEELDYNASLAHVGLRLESGQAQVYLGAQVDYGTEAIVRAVQAGSPGADAGLKEGDVLLSVGEINVSADNGWSDQFRKRYTKANEPFTLKIKRDGQPMTLEARTKLRGQSEYRIVEVENATEAQRNLRKGWLN
ncbi:MAG TPA: PDZ domain-containing protein [Blastocatellia bacterium]|nr:PDZ domain-containing protein [Blastocatellia bacterium]